MDFGLDSRFSALSTSTPSPFPLAASGGGGKTVVELLQDQLASERRVRELERQLEQQTNAPQVQAAAGPPAGQRQTSVCGVFWDYESCRPPPSTNGPALIRELHNYVGRFGAVRTVQMYEDGGSVMPSGERLRSSILSCGVKIQSRGNAKSKGGADHRLLCDLFGHALDFPAPGSTIVLISSDSEYSGMMSALRSRGYDIVLIEGAVSSDELKMSAQEVHKFHDLVRAAGIIAEPQSDTVRPHPSYQQPFERPPPSPFGFAQPSYNPRPLGSSNASLLLSQPSTPTHSDYSSSRSAAFTQPSAISPFPSPFPSFASTPPPAPSTPAPAASASASSDFAPLITAISSRPPRPAPLRSLIGGLVTQIDKHAFARVGVTCAKDYFIAAKEAGVVDMGYGDVSGADWISLAVPGQPRPSAPRPVAPSKPYASVDGLNGAQSRFQVLLNVLNESSYPYPLRAKVCSDLLKIDKNAFRKAGVESWREYVGLAVKEGVVQIGKGEKLGSEWIALPEGGKKYKTRTYPSTAAGASIGKLDLGSVQARRLVEILLRTPSDPPALRSRINDIMLEQDPQFVSTAGFETWAEFAMAAEKAGLVKLGKTDTSPWIVLNRTHWLVGKVLASSPSIPTLPSLPPTSSSRSYPSNPSKPSSSSSSGTRRSTELSASHLDAVHQFAPLCLALLDQPRVPSPLASLIEVEVLRKDANAFKDMHVTRWVDYAALAAEAGVVRLGVREAGPYVHLNGDRILLRKAVEWRRVERTERAGEWRTATRRDPPSAARQERQAEPRRFAMGPTNDWNDWQDTNDNEQDRPRSPGWDIDPPADSRGTNGRGRRASDAESDVQVMSPPSSPQVQQQATGSSTALQLWTSPSCTDFCGG